MRYPRYSFGWKSRLQICMQSILSREFEKNVCMCIDKFSGDGKDKFKILLYTLLSVCIFTTIYF